MDAVNLAAPIALSGALASLPIFVQVSGEPHPFVEWGVPAARAAGEPAQQAAASSRSRRPLRLWVLIALALAAAIVAVIVNLPSSSAPPTPTAQALPDYGGPRPFATVVPLGWQVSATFPVAGVTDYELTSGTAGMPYDDVLPPPGESLIQIQDVPPGAIAQLLGRRAASQGPLGLLDYETRPPGATDVVRTIAPHRATVAGLPGAGDTYAYTYHGRRDVQTLLVTRRGGDIVSIEADAAPSLEPGVQAGLRQILAGWRWVKTAPPRAIQPSIAEVKEPTPTGQWIASGFTDEVTGEIANATLDQRAVRAWYFTQQCASATSCHPALVRQLDDGGTAEARLVRIPNNMFWKAVFPAIHTWCAREPNRPTLKETISDTIDVGWLSSAHSKLIGNETESITGCGDVAPAMTSYHWTATRAPAAATPTISLNPDHAATAAAFRSAAKRVCTRVNSEAEPFASKIAAAEGAMRAAKTAGARAADEQAIVNELPPLVPLTARLYTQIPQPPAGPLDALWRHDIAEQRAQLALGSAALSALQATARATSLYLRAGGALELQTALAQATLYGEDVLLLKRPALAGQIAERALGLPAICTSPPAIDAIGSPPTAF